MVWGCVSTHTCRLVSPPDVERFKNPPPPLLGQDVDRVAVRKQRGWLAQVYLFFIHPHLVHPTMLGCLSPHRVTCRDTSLYESSMQP